MDLPQMNRLADLARDPVVSPWLSALTRAAAEREHAILHANRKGVTLAETVERLPAVQPSSVDLDTDRVRIGMPTDMDPETRSILKRVLEDLKPWRKGPFDIFGIDLDSEWNSSIKWRRLDGHLPSQVGRRVLDIGASNGYYMFRMAARQPELVIGIEPYLNYYFQFLALSRYLDLPHLHCLPLKLEDMPAMRRCFDTVLCMGILYHRRSPLDTLMQIHRMMVPGGQLVLETLIIDGDEEIALFPERRYAQMKNIFFIPTMTCLTHWLTRCGFHRIRCIDTSKTTVVEQHKTAWIDTQSLDDFLDPEHPDTTVEGYPAPVRAMVLAAPQSR
jgi:tRNA (mo5U34)-methyltransferase